MMPFGWSDGRRFPPLSFSTFYLILYLTLALFSILIKVFTSFSTLIPPFIARSGYGCALLVLGFRFRFRVPLLILVS